MDKDEQEVLAVLRTLLAYERNILSIERTQLSQLRTGIALALITPSAIATFTYAFELLPKEYAISIVLYVLLVAITFYGVFMSVSSYLGLKKTKKLKKKIRQKEFEFYQRSGYSKTYLNDLLAQE